MKMQKARKQGHDVLSGLAQPACGCASTRRCRVALVGGRAGASCPNPWTPSTVTLASTHGGSTSPVVVQAWAWLSPRPMSPQGCRLALAFGRAPQPFPLEEVKWNSRTLADKVWGRASREVTRAWASRSTRPTSLSTRRSRSALAGWRPELTYTGPMASLMPHSATAMRAMRVACCRSELAPEVTCLPNMSRVTALHLVVHNLLYPADGGASAYQKACQGAAKALQRLRCLQTLAYAPRTRTGSGVHLVRAKDELLCNTAAHADINRRAYLLPRLRKLVPVRAQHLERKGYGLSKR